MPRVSKYGPSITYSGPFFEKDVRKTFRANARALVEAIAEDGERMVKQNLTPGNGRLTGSYADHVVGSAGALPGKGKPKWALTAAVRNTLYLEMPGFHGFGTFLESGVKGGRKTTFRGLWVYRRVANALKRGSKAAKADLTRGLN